MRSKVLFVGNGWRTQYYMRVINELKEEMEVCGFLMGTRERAKEVAEKTGQPAYANMYEAIAAKPDFVVLTMSRLLTKEMLIGFMNAGIPVLCETPPGMDVQELNEIWEAYVRLNGKVQVAEQYFLQPYYSAVQNVIDSGILGDVLNVNMTAIHRYHAMSIFRKWMNLGFENCRIKGSSFKVSVTKTRSRQGWDTSGEIKASVRNRAELIFDSGKAAFYDFDSENYFSPIRSRRWNVQGTRGEIQNMSVCYLDKDNRPITESFARVDDGIYNIDGWSHLYITFRGQRIYENPFAKARLNDDEIAIASVLMNMKKYVETGEEFYPLREALQDAYLSYIMEEATNTGKEVVTKTQSWA